ncbi:MAG: sodium:proton antiporter [Rhodospirillaceae bacterium]|nr:sodium:proton antiporter [Rhodospirillales bacterium]
MDFYILLLTGGGVIVLLTAWLPMVLKNLPLSLPIVCVGLGTGIFAFSGEGWYPDPLAHPQYAERLTELVVIISLMGAGLKLDRPLGWRSWMITWRLLAVTMPLSILFITLLGWELLGLPLATAVLLGALLAPTDPVLASDVQVGPPGSENEDEVRFSLTSEAGLNDGLAFPFVNLALAMALAEPAVPTWEWFAVDVVWKIAAGIVIGWAIGRGLGLLTFRLPNRAKLSRTGDGFVVLGMTAIAYGVTEMAHGYGFLAVFVAALALRKVERSHAYHEKLHGFAEEIERLLMMLLLVLFGGAIAGGLLAPLTWKAAAVGLLVLCVVRPLTGLMGLVGTKAPREERLVIGFFGIRGIGSFYYLSHALNEAAFAGADFLWAITGFIVLASIIGHGISVTPTMRRLDHPR